MHTELTPKLQPLVDATLADWRDHNKVARLWSGDKSLWTQTDEDQWLGWLHIIDEQLLHVERLEALGAEIAAAGFTHALLLGMGGSSLCPEVLKMTFSTIEGYPELHVLDSTDPAQVKSLENRVDLTQTICIVTSKSGSTLEPNIFKQYFWERVKEVVGAEKVGQHFIAITDPGSKLEAIAHKEAFRCILPGVKSIGGRYSALSYFGLLPAAIMGLDVRKLLDRARAMMEQCRSDNPEDNPGALLGAILGTLGRAGRDKVTLIASPRIGDLGAWLEQLIAESTGKNGIGLIPVDQEEVGSSEVYGDDRVFVHLRLDATHDDALAALAAAGQPVVRIDLHDAYDLGGEFFRWEIATAVAGSILGINPFNQPDVEASKIETRKLTEGFEQMGALPTEQPFFEQDGIQLYADKANATVLRDACSAPSLSGYLRAHFNRLILGDYFAILAYVEMNEEHRNELQSIRHAIRNTHHVATCLGFGPRFLHSTGQAYKGGPNTGVFLQITCDDANDLPVPGQKYRFGVVEAAQARGDFEVLAERGRRVLRMHLGADVRAGLAKLGEMLEN